MMIAITQEMIDGIAYADTTNELVRRSHLKFIQHCWQKTDRFIVGAHTQVICNEIDSAIAKYKQGESSYLIIQVPFRHGKSAIISEYLPPHFLGLFPDEDIIVSTYGKSLSNKMSRSARNIVKSTQYQELYDIKLSAESASVENWEIASHTGTTNWCGIGGAITGKGGALCLIDDYLKNREEAESETTRDKQWEWFSDVFMTRQAPVAITIILATPWHVDDIIGRIKDKINPQSEKYDKLFPKFKVICMPGMSDEYPSGYLFPERFPKEWYEGKSAILGTYGTASLLQCDPIMRGGNLLKVENIKIIEESELPDDLRFVRAWDLASSEKERVKTNPDYTVGCLMAVKKVEKDGIDDLMSVIYIKHINRMRAEAPQRNAAILSQSNIDGDKVEVGVEAVAGYKDAYIQIRDLLDGVRTVRNITVSKDKVVRATALEPIFEAGNIYLVKGEWNQAFLDEIGAFPSGAHDDQVDAMVGGYEMTNDFVDWNSMKMESKAKNEVSI